MPEPTKTKAALVKDIEELKLKLAQLEEQRHFCNDAYALAHIGIWEHDVSTGKTLYSDGLYHIFEYELNEIKPSKLAFLERVVPEDKALLQTVINEACANKKTFAEADYRIDLPSGAQTIVHTNISFTYDADGKLERMTGTVQDVTANKHSEEQLRRSEENFRRLMESNPVAIAVTNKEGLCMTANPAMVKIFGYDSEEDFKSVPVYKHYHDIEDRKQLYAALERDGMIKDFPVTAKRKDGTLYFGELTSVYIKSKEAGYEMLTMFVDTTERVRHEAEIKKTIEFLNTAQKMAQMGSFDWDLVTNDIVGSDEAMRIFDYNKGDKITYDVFLESVHPLDKDHVIKSVEASIADKKPLDMEYRIIRKDDEERTINGRAVIASGHDGKAVKMTGTVHDITEKKKLDAELLRAQKLETIGVLAGGIAHDFNNLLLGIIGNVSLAKNFVKQDDRVFTFLNNIEKTAIRTKDLTSQLLTFSKGGEPVKEVQPIKQLLKDCATLTLRGANIECKYDISDTLPNVDIDEGQISQVFNNMFLNARHAILQAGGRVLYIDAKKVHAGGATDAALLADGDYVRISIKDTGTGIPHEIIHKIFDPFFTTREHASGLGLAVSYSIIKKHGGHISVESKPGQGATFDVYLPAAETVKAAAHTPALNEPAAYSADKVLVMDDEEVVRDVSGEMLKLIGYNVEFASNGEQAVKIYKKAWDTGAPYVAVIMDLTIPCGMGGREAIGKLIEINPEIKVIVSSGHSKDPIMSSYKEYGFAGVLAKPYRVSEFSRVVKDVITGKS